VHKGKIFSHATFAQLGSSKMIRDPGHNITAPDLTRDKVMSACKRS